MRKESNYLYLMIGLLPAVVLVSGTSPLSLFARMGDCIAVLSLLMTAYLLSERRGQLLLALLLGERHLCLERRALGAIHLLYRTHSLPRNHHCPPHPQQ